MDLFFFLFDSIALFFLRFQIVSQRQPVVMVIRTDALGDFILGLPLFSALHSKYKGYRIICCASDASAEYAHSIQNIDEVLEIDRKRMVSDLRYRKKVLRALHLYRAEIVIHPVYSRSFAVGDALVRASSSQKSIGFDGDTTNSNYLTRLFSRIFYTSLVKDVDPKIHESKKIELFIEALGVKPQIAVFDRQKEVESSTSFSTVVLFVSAGSLERCWPLDRFAVIAQHIESKYGMQILLCGGGELKHQVIESLFLFPSNCKNLVGMTSIAQLTEIISKTKLIITNETSAMHLAYAYRTPVISIVGGGHFNRFALYPTELTYNESICINSQMPCFNCNWQCIFVKKSNEPFLCISEISTVDVIKAVDKLLSRSQAI